MGREIRRVPPNWRHPKEHRADFRAGTYVEHFVPMFDKNLDAALAEWLVEFDKARFDVVPQDELVDPPGGLAHWLKDNPPPDPAQHHTWLKAEATWYQLYETVSEGTPVTPPFATKDELVEYLVENGDKWDQRRAGEDGRLTKPGWSREAAEQMVQSEWAPSMMVVRGGPQAGIYDASTGFPK